MLGPVHRDHLGLWHPGESRRRFRWPQVIILAGDQGQQRLASGRPGVQVRVGGPAQRRRDQDRALHRRIQAPLQRQLAAERPAEQPQPGQPGGHAPGDGRGHVVPFRFAAAELPAAAPAFGGGATGVEAQHRQAGHGRQPVGRLAQQVAVHHAAVRRQRVQADQGGHRRSAGGQRQLPHQRQAVGGADGDRLPAGGQHRAGPDLGHRLLTCSRGGAGHAGAAGAASTGCASGGARPGR